MIREEALAAVSTPYQYEEDLLDYTKSKLGLTDTEWDGIFNAPAKSFHDYPTYYPFLSTLRLPVYLAGKMGFVDDLLYLKFFG
jgi:hypothetical protein